MGGWGDGYAGASLTGICPLAVLGLALVGERVGAPVRVAEGVVAEDASNGDERRCEDGSRQHGDDES